MAIDIARIRNVGFVGHGGVGKTSLVEAILFRNGMTSRLGRVDDGTATTDFDPEEVKRKISINIGVAHCDYREHRFNFVDMPGYGDFIAEARAGLRVVEGAVLVVDAVAGVEVQTEKVSSSPRSTGCPAWSSSTGWTASGPTSAARSSRSSAGSRGASCHSTSRSARSPGSAGSWTSCG